MSMSLIVIKPRQCVIFVNQQKFLDLICHQNLLSFLKRYGPRGRHQLVAGHDFGDLQLASFEEAQIAAGDDAHQLGGPGVIGTPETLYCCITSRARPTVASGGSVTGSKMIPLRLRFTLSTSSVCRSTDMFL